MTIKIPPEMLNKWARLFASEIDPEYENIAPMMMEAYFRGGRERKQLFENSSSLGGFLSDGGMSLMPFAYVALSAVVTSLMTFYSAGGLRAIADMLTIWKNCLEIAKIKQPVKDEAHMHMGSAEALQSLRRILDEVHQTLKKQGLPSEQCELVSYRVMKVLLQEPNEAAQLVLTIQNERK